MHFILIIFSSFFFSIVVSFLGYYIYNNFVVKDKERKPCVATKKIRAKEEKRFFIFTGIVFVFFSIVIIISFPPPSKGINEGKSTPIYTPQPSSSVPSNYKTCDYCRKSFSGDGYNYVNGICHSGSSSYYSNCSMKCCSEALQNDPYLDRKWKNGQRDLRNY